MKLNTNVRWADEPGRNLDPASLAGMFVGDLSWDMSWTAATPYYKWTRSANCGILVIPFLGGAVVGPSLPVLPVICLSDEVIGAAARVNDVPVADLPNTFAGDYERQLREIIYRLVIDLPRVQPSQFAPAIVSLIARGSLPLGTARCTAVTPPPGTSSGTPRGRATKGRRGRN